MSQAIGGDTAAASRALFERAKALIPGGVNSPVRAFRAVGGEPRFIERGLGARVWDADGHEYIDYVGSWGPLLLGHAHPADRGGDRRAGAARHRVRRADAGSRSTMAERDHVARAVDRDGAHGQLGHRGDDGRAAAGARRDRAARRSSSSRAATTGTATASWSRPARAPPPSGRPTAPASPRRSRGTRSRCPTTTSPARSQRVRGRTPATDRRGHRRAGRRQHGRRAAPPGLPAGPARSVHARPAPC